MTNAKRIVTGWSQKGAPRILYRGSAPTMLDFGAAQATELWVTDAVPAGVRSRHDHAAREWQLEPPPGGSAFRLVAYSPGAEIDLHSTETLDYIVVIRGELTLVLPDEEITLHEGDTVIQQATPHGWANRSSEPCVIAVVLLSAVLEGAA